MVAAPETGFFFGAAAGSETGGGGDVGVVGCTEVLIASGAAESVRGRGFKDSPAIDAMSCGVDVLRAGRSGAGGVAGRTVAALDARGLLDAGGAEAFNGKCATAFGGAGI